MKKITAEEAQNKINESERPYITLDSSTYKGMDQKARFIDSEYGEWWARPDCVINRKSDHKKRGLLKGGRQRRIPISKVLNRAKKLGISLDTSTYEGMHKKARFIDPKLGEWWSSPDKVLNRGQRHPLGKGERFKQTCLTKYGVTSVSQLPSHKEKYRITCLKKYGKDSHNKVREISLKQTKGLNRLTVLFHWKTLEPLDCIGSYEVKTIKWLNVNKIDYLWQPQTFLLPDGTTYRPDLFLIKEDKWVEIKGWSRDKFKKKWAYFILDHPTAELWTRKILKSKGIL